MEQNDFKDFTEYERACERKCNKFHEATRKYRLSKVHSKFPFIEKIQLWFYGLEKVDTKYSVIDKNGNVKGYYFSEYDAELEKSKDDKVIEVKITDFDLNYSSPYDIIRYKIYLAWVKRIERKGMKLNRPWLDNTVIRYWPQEEHNYGKFRKLKRMFHHKYHNCIWDASDSTDEIIRLTVAGMYHLLWGHSVEHRECAHEIWTYRKMLIKSQFYDEYWDYYNIELKVREKYGIPYSIEVYNREEYLENGITAIGAKNSDVFNATINPILVENIVERKMKNGIVAETNKDYRKRVLDKICEIENFVYDRRTKECSYENMNKDWKKLKLEAAEYRVNHENGWCD